MDESQDSQMKEDDVVVNGGQRQNVQNTTPLFLQHCFYFVFGLVEKYGWFMVLGAILLAFVWNKFKPQLMRILKKWEDEREINNHDPIKAAELQAKIDESRRRWQEVLDAKAAKYEEQRKQLEEEKRKEMIEDWEGHQQGKGYRSKKFKKTDESSLAQSVLKPKKKTPLRDPDHSPLTGGGSGGSSYRPARRGGGG